MKKLLVLASCCALTLLSGGWAYQKLRSSNVPTQEVRLSQSREDRRVAPVAAAPEVQKDVPFMEKEIGVAPAGSIVVVDEERRSIPNANVLYSLGEGEKVPLVAAQGRFELPADASGAAKVFVSAAEHFPEAIEVSNFSPGESREVVLMAIHELSVRTLMESTKVAAPGCEVYVYRNLSNENLIIGGTPSEILKTLTDGTATVTNVRSTDKLHLFAVNEPGSVMSTVEEVKLPFDDVVLHLKPMRFVRGMVLSEDERPIAGADVWIYEAGERKSWSPDWRVLRGLELGRKPLEMDRTDDEGSFLIRWPANWRPLVAARAEGFVVSLRELRPEELGQSIELVLKRSALIDGIVVDEKGQPATADAAFGVSVDESEKPDPVKPWRVYFHEELNVPFRFVLKDIEYESARYLIVEHRGKYKRQTIQLTDDERQGKQQMKVILEPDPTKQVLIELAVIPLDKVTGWQPADPHPHVQVTRVSSEEDIPVEGNNSYGGFGWWSAVEPGEYRIDVVTRGFFTVTRKVQVQEGSKRPSESRCCAEQFRVELPLERDPAFKHQLNLPELLQVEILDGRDRKPPPEHSDIIFEVFQLPGRTPACQKLRNQLEYRDGAALRRTVLKAGTYEVRIDCEGFLPKLLEVVLPQESPIIEVLLSPEWQSPDEARAAIPELVRKLRYDIDERGRAQAALSRIGADAAPALTDLLGDDDLQVRCSALLVLGSIRPPSPDVYERIVPLLESPEARIRSCAAQALGSLGKEAEPAIPALVRLLEDPDSQVRSRAAHALGALGPAAREASAAPLRNLLHDENEWARLAAKRALQHIGEPEVR